MNDLKVAGSAKYHSTGRRAACLSATSYLGSCRSGCSIEGRYFARELHLCSLSVVLVNTQICVHFLSGLCAHYFDLIYCSSLESS